MKATLTTCAGLLLALFCFAGQLPTYDSFRCRSTYDNIDPSLSLAEQLRIDLTSGVWIDETNEGFVQEMLSFDPSGHGEWIREAGKELYQKEKMSWGILEQNSDLILVVSADGRQPKVYSIAPNCEGIVLTDTRTHKVYTYTYVRPKADNQINNIREELIGRWENVLPQVKLSASGNPEIPTLTLTGVKVVFDFKANGQFQKSIISNDDVTYQENGRWEISRDGKYIYLHCQDSEEGPLTQAVKIKHFDLDELVLEQPLAVIGKSYCTDNQYFFFNKI